MAVTGATVKAALAAVGAVGGQLRSFDELAAGADGALRQAPAGLTAAGAASFLATMAQESAYLRTTTEYGAKLSYDPYRGRTFEQITFEGNYRDFGRWCAARKLVADPEAFVKNPASLSDYAHAWNGGIWYFAAKGLWAYANRGDHYAVSQGVNRGVGAIGGPKAPLHWKERKAMYDAFLRAGNSLLPSGAPAPPAPAPAPKGDWMIYDKTFLAVGHNDFRLPLPVGSASASWGLAEAVVSVVGNGPVTGTIYVQSDRAGIENWPVKVTVAPGGICARFWKYVPSGTTQLGIVLDAPNGGTVSIEGREK